MIGVDVIQMENMQVKPLLVVVLMVKNEATALVATLDSYLSAGLTHFLVFDTGSSDDTVQLALNYFQQAGVSGVVEQEPFVDFATSRNRALELAESQFSEATFFVMPDAEWHLQNGDALINFCKQEYDTATPLYLLTIRMNTVEFTTARLFRAASRIRFKGVVHEVPETVACVKAPASIFFEVNATTQGVEKSKRRWQQDLILLQKAAAENPADPRTLFYLAQTYECLGLLEAAYQSYLARSKLKGWDEENFITFFRLGYLAEQLHSDSLKTETTWDVAMNHFLKAFSLRAHRIEPLVKMAAHYWPSNIQACYLFIKQAYDVPFPSNDWLFIEKNMYLYDRYEIMSRCAWYMGEYALGEEATLRALQVHPDMPHLQQNLVLYQDKLAFLGN